MVTAHGFAYSRALATVALICGTSAHARAFGDYELFFADPVDGGAGGRWFTGSPADGYTCSVCHEGGRQWPVQVDGLPTGQGYLPDPNKPYSITLSWNEFRGREIELFSWSAATALCQATLRNIAARRGQPG